MSVKASSLDLSYLTARTKDLPEECHIMVLMIDEDYTAQRIEYSNGYFVGLTEEGKRAKTVLTFMIQSVSRKYKNVVCLLPVNQLDTGFLKKWFDKVMVALNDLFFVVAVSVDNHVCNRYATRMLLLGLGSQSRRVGAFLGLQELESELAKIGRL